MKVVDAKPAEVQGKFFSTPPTHQRQPAKPLSHHLVLELLGDGESAGRRSVAECSGGLEKFLRLHYNFMVDPTRRPR